MEDNSFGGKPGVRHVTAWQGLLWAKAVFHVSYHRICEIAETREIARENVRFGLQAYIDYRNTNAPKDAPAMAVPVGEDPVDWIIRTGYAVIGTPDDAIARIQQLLDKEGEFGAFLSLALNWADWQQTLRSYELYARYVIPHFAKANVGASDRLSGPRRTRRNSYNSASILLD